MKRSMDDVRFVPGSDEVVNAEKLEGDWTLVWHCPWCDDECSVALKDIESMAVLIHIIYMVAAYRSHV